MAVSDNNQNSNGNLRNENLTRERQEERQERREERTERREDRRQSNQNNNMALLACVPFLTGFNRNNNIIIGQTETQTRDFSTNFIPSSIQIYDIDTNNVGPGDEVPLTQLNLNTGVSYTFLNPNQIQIISAGVYVITFTANLSGVNPTQTANFVIAVDGTENLISQISQTVLDGQTYNVKTQLLLKVTNPPATISVINNGTDAINVSNANLLITKTANF